jgi:hypothetical protein
MTSPLQVVDIQKNNIYKREKHLGLKSWVRGPERFRTPNERIRTRRNPLVYRDLGRLPCGSAT